MRKLPVRPAQMETWPGPANSALLSNAARPFAPARFQNDWTAALADLSRDPAPANSPGGARGDCEQSRVIAGKPTIRQQNRPMKSPGLVIQTFRQTRQLKSVRKPTWCLRWRRGNSFSLLSISGQQRSRATILLHQESLELSDFRRH